MQIDRISKISTSTAEWATATVEPKSKENESSSPTAVREAASVSPSVAVAPSKPASSSIANHVSATGLQVTTLAATYSRTVSGKSYPESIEESGGVYVASVPSPPGITASGTTVESAENSLNMKLDTLA
jgi:myo-inositol-hexaphosphate 3-phosphohydrolase